MDEAFRNLLIAVILLAITGAGYVAALLKARASLVGKFQEAELARQEQTTKERKALTETLDSFKTLFAGERTAREKLQVDFDALEQKYDKREREIKQFIEQQSTDQKRIEALESDKKQRDEQIKTLSKRVAALEQERDGLAQQVKERDGELKKRDETIAHQQNEIVTLNQKVDALQKRIDDLEKKGDTDKLDPAKVPDPAPEPVAETPAESAAPEHGTVGEVDAAETKEG